MQQAAELVVEEDIVENLLLEVLQVAAKQVGLSTVSNSFEVGHIGSELEDMAVGILQEGVAGRVADNMVVVEQ